MAQASVLLFFQYAATLSRRRGPDLSLQYRAFPGIDLVSITYVKYCHKS